MDFGKHPDKHWGFGEQYLESYYQRRNARMDPESGFNNIDRNWRRAFMKAQSFSPNDAALDLYANPDYKKARYNIFRRIARAPMDFVEFNIIQKFQPNYKAARAIRHGISIVIGFYVATLGVTYFALYRGNDWTKYRTPYVIYKRPRIMPSSSEYPEMPSYQRTSKSQYGLNDYTPDKFPGIKPSTPTGPNSG